MRELFDPSVSYLSWVALGGALALTLALASTQLRRLPISSSILYFTLGILLGPAWLGWLHVEFGSESTWLEHVTEFAVVTSLFIGGLKLRLPYRSPAWRAVPRLAGPVMLVCIFGLALFAHLALRLNFAAALLLGAVLAPTDPVLASSCSVSAASDCDRMRYGLSGEAGLNDGMAFPFVVLALGWAERKGPGMWMTSWFASRVLWAVPVALVLGYLLGKNVGRLAVWLRSRQRDLASPSDLLALALIAVSYSLAEAVHAWGFLCVFAAGVGLRAAEMATISESPHPEVQRDSSTELHEAHPPAEDLVSSQISEEALEQPAVAVGRMVGETLAFGDTAERLLELTLVILVGASIWDHWDYRAIPVALVLFGLLRPLATRALLGGTPTSSAQRWLMGWFGIRGIGSLYYLAYAINHDTTQTAGAIENITISVVALSIVIHGVSAQPLLARYEQLLARANAPRAVSRPAAST